MARDEIMEIFGFTKTENNDVYYHNQADLYIDAGIYAISSIVTVLVREAYDEGFKEGRAEMRKALGIDKVLKRIESLEKKQII